MLTFFNYFIELSAENYKKYLFSFIFLAICIDLQRSVRMTLPPDDNVFDNGFYDRASSRRNVASPMGQMLPLNSSWCPLC